MRSACNKDPWKREGISWADGRVYSDPVIREMSRHKAYAPPSSSNVIYIACPLLLKMYNAGAVGCICVVNIRCFGGMFSFVCFPEFILFLFYNIYHHISLQCFSYFIPTDLPCFSSKAVIIRLLSRDTYCNVSVKTHFITFSSSILVSATEYNISIIPTRSKRNTNILTPLFSCKAPKRTK